jgi:transcriptional regulator with XRE-family HTH domain
MFSVDEPEILVRNLIFLRKKYALSHSALAALTGIRRPLWRMMEREGAVPPLTEERLRRLCQIFNVTTAELLETDLSL